MVEGTVNCSLGCRFFIMTEKKRSLKEMRTIREMELLKIYKEVPVDIITFISDDRYLGRVTDNGKAVYPIWKEALKEIFSDNSKLYIVFTGGIRTGKSTIALYSICYIMYLLLLLRDPWKYFSLAIGGKMSISFFNLTKSLGSSRGFTKLQSFLAKSPWFIKQASYVSKSKGEELLEFSLFEYLLASPYAKGFAVIGSDVVCGILDEVDSPNEGAKQKARVLAAYDATARRFKNTFASTGYSLGKLFLVASRQGEQSFIDNFITKMKNDPQVKVFDIPLWEAKPKHIFCGEKFVIAIGDAFNPSKIIDKSEAVEHKAKGFNIIEVPVEFKAEFQQDIIGSLRDTAGITVEGMRKSKLIPSENLIIECFDETKRDPVKVQTISIGLKDEVDLMWYLDLTAIRVPRTVQRFVSFDIAFTHDAAALAMSCVKEWKEITAQKEDGTFVKYNMPVIETDFVMRIKAKEGDRIPIHKIRKLVLDLKAVGFIIAEFSSDLPLAAEDTFQLLSAAGVKTEYQSVDKDPKPYLDLINLIYEKRWICHRHPMILIELANLEKDPTTGKVDHPETIADVEFLDSGETREVIMEGSKDMADAIAQSIYRALLNTNPQIPAGLMVDLIRRSNSNLLGKTEKIDLKMFAPDGQEIIQVQTSEGMKNLAEIMRKRRIGQ